MIIGMDSLKKRSPNFTRAEKHLLGNIILQKYKNIVENKKTDAVSVRLKEQAWNKIMTSFNICSAGIRRDAKMLRNCYENMKRRAKLQLQRDKLETHQTADYSFPPNLDETGGKLAETLVPQSVIDACFEEVEVNTSNFSLIEQGNGSNIDFVETPDIDCQTGRNIIQDGDISDLNVETEVLETVHSPPVLTPTSKQKKSGKALLEVAAEELTQAARRKLKTEESRAQQITLKNKTIAAETEYWNAKREKEIELFEIKRKHMEAKSTLELEVLQLQKSYWQKQNNGLN